MYSGGIFLAVITILFVLKNDVGAEQQCQCENMEEAWKILESGDYEEIITFVTKPMENHVDDYHRFKILRNFSAQQSAVLKIIQQLKTVPVQNRDDLLISFLVAVKNYLHMDKQFETDITTALDYFILKKYLPNRPLDLRSLYSPIDDIIPSSISNVDYCSCQKGIIEMLITKLLKLESGREVVLPSDTEDLSIINQLLEVFQQPQYNIDRKIIKKLKLLLQSSEVGFILQSIDFSTYDNLEGIMDIILRTVLESTIRKDFRQIALYFLRQRHFPYLEDILDIMKQTFNVNKQIISKLEVLLYSSEVQNIIDSLQQSSSSDLFIIIRKILEIMSRSSTHEEYRKTARYFLRLIEKSSTKIDKSRSENYNEIEYVIPTLYPQPSTDYYPWPSITPPKARHFPQLQLLIDQIIKIFKEKYHIDQHMMEKIRLLFYSLEVQNVLNSINITHFDNLHQLLELVLKTILQTSSHSEYISIANYCLHQIQLKTIIYPNPEPKPIWSFIPQPQPIPSQPLIDKIIKVFKEEYHIDMQMIPKLKDFFYSSEVEDIISSVNHSDYTDLHQLLELILRKILETTTHTEYIKIANFCLHQIRIKTSIYPSPQPKPHKPTPRWSSILLPRPIPHIITKTHIRPKLIPHPHPVTEKIIKIFEEDYHIDIRIVERLKNLFYTSEVQHIISSVNQSDYEDLHQLLQLILKKIVQTTTQTEYISIANYCLHQIQIKTNVYPSPQPKPHRPTPRWSSILLPRPTPHFITKTHIRSKHILHPHPVTEKIIKIFKEDYHIDIQIVERLKDLFYSSEVQHIINSVNQSDYEDLHQLLQLILRKIVQTTTHTEYISIANYCLHQIQIKTNIYPSPQPKPKPHRPTPRWSSILLPRPTPHFITKTHIRPKLIPHPHPVTEKIIKIFKEDYHIDIQIVEQLKNIFYSSEVQHIISTVNQSDYKDLHQLLQLILRKIVQTTTHTEYISIANYCLHQIQIKTNVYPSPQPKPNRPTPRWSSILLPRPTPHFITKTHIKSKHILHPHPVTEKIIKIFKEDYHIDIRIVERLKNLFYTSEVQHIINSVNQSDYEDLHQLLQLILRKIVQTTNQTEYITIANYCLHQIQIKTNVYPSPQPKPHRPTPRWSSILLPRPTPHFITKTHIRPKLIPHPHPVTEKIIKIFKEDYHIDIQIVEQLKNIFYSSEVQHIISTVIQSDYKDLHQLLQLILKKIVQTTTQTEYISIANYCLHQIKQIETKIYPNPKSRLRTPILPVPKPIPQPQPLIEKMIEIFKDDYHIDIQMVEKLKIFFYSSEVQRIISLINKSNHEDLHQLLELILKKTLETTTQPQFINIAKYCLHQIQIQTNLIQTNNFLKILPKPKTTKEILYIERVEKVLKSFQFIKILHRHEFEQAPNDTEKLKILIKFLLSNRELSVGQRQALEYYLVLLEVKSHTSSFERLIRYIPEATTEIEKRYFQMIVKILQSNDIFILMKNVNLEDLDEIQTIFVILDKIISKIQDQKVIACATYYRHLLLVEHYGFDYYNLLEELITNYDKQDSQSIENLLQQVLILKQFFSSAEMRKIPSQDLQRIKSLAPQQQLIHLLELIMKTSTNIEVKTTASFFLEKHRLFQAFKLSLDTINKRLTTSQLNKELIQIIRQFLETFKAYSIIAKFNIQNFPDEDIFVEHIFKAILSSQVDSSVIDACQNILSYMHKLIKLEFKTVKEIKKNFKLDEIFTDVFNLERMTIAQKYSFHQFFEYLVSASKSPIFNNFDNWDQAQTRGAFVKLFLQYLLKEAAVTSQIKKHIHQLLPLVQMTGKGALPP